MTPEQPEYGNSPTLTRIIGNTRVELYVPNITAEEDARRRKVASGIAADIMRDAMRKSATSVVI